MDLVELVKIFGRVAGTIRPGNGEDATIGSTLMTSLLIKFARQHRLQGIYNLVDGAHLTSRELLDKVCEQHSLPRLYGRVPQERPTL